MKGAVEPWPSGYVFIGGAKWLYPTNRKWYFVFSPASLESIAQNLLGTPRQTIYSEVADFPGTQAIP
jgi:hypothetical protein